MDEKIIRSVFFEPQDDLIERLHWNYSNPWNRKILVSRLKHASSNSIRIEIILLLVIILAYS